MKNIAFWSSGPQQGKTTASNRLLSRAPRVYKKVSFADPLRDMLSVLIMESVQCSEAEAHYYMTEGKELTIPVIGRSFRYLARTLGTEWGRNLVGQSLWRSIAVGKIVALNSSGLLVCVDDARFPNEIEALRATNFKLVKIVRNTGRSDNHASDTALAEFDEWDCVIENNGTLADFYGKIDSLLE